MSLRDAVLVEVMRRSQAADPVTTPQRVLLLHGMGGGPSNWDQLVPLLGRHMESWDAALPWTTTASADWAHDTDVTRWIRAAIDAMPARPDLVVAHSFAANALLELIDRTPGWSTPVVLIAPFYRPETRDFDFTSMNYYVEGFHRMLDDGIALYAGDRLGPQQRRDIVERMCAWLGPYTWLRFFDTYLRTPLLGTTSMTVEFLLIGAQNDHGAFASGVAALGERLPNARTEILPDTGHFAMVERPADVAGAVNTFAEQVRDRRIREVA